MYIIYIYIYIYIYIHTLPVIAMMALWQLVHLGTPMYGYMLAFRTQRKLKLTLEQQV